jgi:uncharacterized protein (TIGR02145 family)
LISIVGSNAGEKLKAKSGEWRDYYGTDIYGFGGLPGGELYRDEFQNLNIKGLWWTSSESGSLNANQKVMDTGDNVSNHNVVKTDYFSIRCVED